MALLFTPALRKEYLRLFTTTKVRPQHAAEAKQIADALFAQRARYESAGHPIGVPWWMVAVIHSLEASRNFNAHLHNGDPLAHRTVHVPKNRPLGVPPFTWEESARDALTQVGFASVADWSISSALFRLEGYNGTGYRGRGINTPYLWSFSQHYAKGKFASDGRFDPSLVSQQCGAGVLLRILVDEGRVKTLPSKPAKGGPSVPFPGRVLKLRKPLMSGEDVHAFQARMHTLGLPIAPDGQYGEQSKRVTGRFQTARGLTADGIVGEQTWNAAFTD